MGIAYGIIYLNHMDDNKNTTVENISNYNVTQQNNTTNETTNSKNSESNKKSSTKTSQSKSSSNYGGSDVDENGYMKAPPDDSGNWVVVGGKWKPAVTYKNGHYYDYHGDNVDHKMK